MAVPITIDNANIEGEGGSITNATITGDATIETPPDTGERPTHPILLPPPLPPGSNPDAFWMLCFCPNPPPPHWEFIMFLPGSPPERPHPQPPEPPIETTPGGDKPPPANGGWGYSSVIGWYYWPGPSGAGPKKAR